MANELQERFADSLLDRIRSDQHPSATHMDMFESVATPPQLAEYIVDLVERIEEEPHPSIPMMQRVQRLVAMFG